MSFSFSSFFFFFIFLFEIPIILRRSSTTLKKQKKGFKEDFHSKHLHSLILIPFLFPFSFSLPQHHFFSSFIVSFVFLPLFPHLTHVKDNKFFFVVFPYYLSLHPRPTFCLPPSFSSLDPCQRQQIFLCCFSLLPSIASSTHLLFSSLFFLS